MRRIVRPPCRPGRRAPAPSRRAPAPRPRAAAHGAQALHDVAERRHVREQVELLEHHADALAHAREPPRVALAVAAGARADRLAVELDDAGVRQLHEVEAAQQRALARAGRAEDGDALALRDVEVDAAQHLVAAEALGEAADAGAGVIRPLAEPPLQHIGRAAPAARGRRRRSRPRRCRSRSD